MLNWIIWNRTAFDFLIVGNFHSLAISLRTEQKIWKQLDESNRDYEDKITSDPLSDRSDKKIIAEFLVRSRLWLTTNPASQSGP